MNVLILLFALFSLVVATPWYNDPSNLVCFYPLIDGSFADASGRTTAVVTPSPPPPPVAVNVMGTVFNNPSSSSIAVQWNGPFTFSVSMMFSFNAPPNNPYVLLGSSSTDITQKAAITLTASSIVVRMGGGVATYPLVWSIGRWQHLVVVFGSPVAVFVDGQQLSAGSSNGAFSTPTVGSAVILLGDPIITWQSAPVALFNFRQYSLQVSAEQASEVYAADWAQLCTGSPSAFLPQCIQSFETPVVGDIDAFSSFGPWQLDQNRGQAGIARSGSWMAGPNNPPVPDGQQYAWFTTGGNSSATLYAVVTNLTVGLSYRVTFSWDIPMEEYINGTASLSVNWNGNVLYNATNVVPPPNWVPVVSAPFTAESTEGTLQFVDRFNNVTGFDNNFVIDAVVVVPA